MNMNINPGKGKKEGWDKDEIRIRMLNRLHQTGFGKLIGVYYMFIEGKDLNF